MCVSVEVCDEVYLELTRAGNRQTPLVNRVYSYLPELAEASGRAFPTVSTHRHRRLRC